MPVPKGSNAKIPSKRAGLFRLRGKNAANADFFKALSFRGKIGAADGRNIFLSEVIGKMPKPELREIRKEYRENKKTRIPMTKTLEVATLKLALNRAFMSHVGALGLLKSKKRPKLKKIISRLYEKGDISLKGEIEIKFTEETKKEIKKILGSHANSFMSELSDYIKYEAGEVRFYVRSIIDPAAVLGQWNGFTKVVKTRRKK